MPAITLEKYEDVAAARSAVVKEAFEWVGTPYAHAHDIKGAGVDCAMLLVRVYVDCGLIPAFDPRPYHAQWFLHHDEPRYMNFVQEYGHRVDDPLPGDIAMYNFGRHAAHGAIVVDAYTMIHAYRLSRRVIHDLKTSLEGRLDSYWSLF